MHASSALQPHCGDTSLQGCSAHAAPELELAVDPAEVPEDDAAELLAFMDGDASIRPGPVGSIGYCMGGRHVLCIAGKFPSRFKANACLHGVEIVTDKPDSPHRLAMAAEGEFEQFSNAIPRASFELIRQSLREAAGRCDEAREMLRKLREASGN
mgnify:CR=1 FL=1